MACRVSSAPRKRIHCPGVTSSVRPGCACRSSLSLTSIEESLLSDRNFCDAAVTWLCNERKCGSCGGQGGGSNRQRSRVDDAVRGGDFFLAPFAQGTDNVDDDVECATDALSHWFRHANRSASVDHSVGLFWYCRSSSLESPCFFWALNRFIGVEMSDCGTVCRSIVRVIVVS
jgi:hypothetical protein